MGLAEPEQRPAWEQEQAECADEKAGEKAAAGEAGEEDGESDLGLHHGGGKHDGEEGAGGDEGGPLRGDESSPERVGEKDAEADIVFAGEAEGEEGRAKTVENSGGDFRAHVQQRKCWKGGGERILFEGSVVGILMSDEALREVEGPGEISGVLMETGDQEATI